MISLRPLSMALAMICIVPQLVRAELSLGELRLKFEVAVESDGAKYESKALKLRGGYISALKRLKLTLGREGKLEQAAQVLSEMELFDTNDEVKPLVERADYRLKNLRLKWTKGQEKLGADRRTKVAELATVYLKVLEERKVALTRAGEIRKALEVNEEAKRVREIDEVSRALSKRAPGGRLRGVYGDGNLALASKGAKAIGPKNPELMIDGLVTNITDRGGWAWGYIPCEFSVEFPKLYVISKIRLLLWDRDLRVYSWRVEVSTDGENWAIVDDQERDPSSDRWKEIKFDPRDVRHVRVKGYGEIVKKGFAVVELEAYSPEE